MSILWHQGQNHGVAVFLDEFIEVEGPDLLGSACIWTPMNKVHESDNKTGIRVCK